MGGERDEVGRRAEALPPTLFPSPFGVAGEVETLRAPVLDMARLRLPPPARSLLVQDIGRACRQFGFFQVINHGLSPATAVQALSSACAFFDLPPEAKDWMASDNVKKPVRYESRLSNTLDGVRFCRFLLKHYAHPLADWLPFWPSEPSDYREKMGNYALEVRMLAMQLTEIILESLGLGPAYMRERFEQGAQVMAVNCYPASPHPDMFLGLPPHSDFGCLTVLLQSCRGLQVLDKEDNTWRWVPDLPGCLQVHVGDHLEVVSNGRYKSVIHRVILNAEMQRVSIGSIHCLAMDETIEPADRLVDEQAPRGYRATTFKEFLDFTSDSENLAKGSYIDNLKITECE